MRIISEKNFRLYCIEHAKKNKFCVSHNTRVSDAMINVIFKTLDIDGNGYLDHDEITGVLEGRMKLGQGDSDDLKLAVNQGFTKILSQFRERTGL